RDEAAPDAAGYIPGMPGDRVRPARALLARGTGPAVEHTVGRQSQASVRQRAEVEAREVDGAGVDVAQGDVRVRGGQVEGDEQPLAGVLAQEGQHRLGRVEEADE